MLKKGRTSGYWIGEEGDFGAGELVGYMIGYWATGCCIPCFNKLKAAHDSIKEIMEYEEMRMQNDECPEFDCAYCHAEINRINHMKLKQGNAPKFA